MNDKHVTFYRNMDTGYFVCTCKYSTKIPDDMRKHLKRVPLSHVGTLPTGSYVNPSGVMVAGNRIQMRHLTLWGPI